MYSHDDIKVFDDGLDFPLADGNVDVEVRDPQGRRWSATFYTLQNVQSLLAKWRASGESGGGSYFWGGPDAIVVEQITLGVIHTTIDALRAAGDLETVFSLLAESGDPDW